MKCFPSQSYFIEYGNKKLKILRRVTNSCTENTSTLGSSDLEKIMFIQLLQTNSCTENTSTLGSSDLEKIMFIQL